MGSGGVESGLPTLGALLCGDTPSSMTGTMTLPLIKILLLGGIVLFAVLAFRGGSRASYRLLWRGYGVMVAAAAVLAVLFPDSLTRLAELVGVGRGADLLLYVLVVTFLLTSVVLLRRVSTLERRYVELSRAMALQQALPPPSDDEDRWTDDS